NSFLVLSWIVPAIVAIDAWRSTERSSPSAQRFRVTIRSLLGRSELFLLPPIYWLGKKILEPTYGLYSHYNQFRMSIPAALKQTIATFFKQFDRSAAVLLPRLSDL